MINCLFCDSHLTEQTSYGTFKIYKCLKCPLDTTFKYRIRDEKIISYSFTYKLNDKTYIWGVHINAQINDLVYYELDALGNSKSIQMFKFDYPMQNITPNNFPNKLQTLLLFL